MPSLRTYHRTSRRSWGVYLIPDSHILRLGRGYTTLTVIGRSACPRCIRRSLRLGHFIMPLCGFVGFAEHLIAAHSEDVNSEGGSHTTPLHAASVKGHLASLLLRSGADPDSCDHLGRVPLHRVSQGGQLMMTTKSSLEVARLLVNSGADVNVPDYEAPLHAAAQSGVRWVVWLRSQTTLGRAHLACTHIGLSSLMSPIHYTTLFLFSTTARSSPDPH
jgi:hypothetical protein